jgi:hypothetical protein
MNFLQPSVRRPIFAVRVLASDAGQLASLNARAGVAVRRGSTAEKRSAASMPLQLSQAETYQPTVNASKTSGVKRRERRAPAPSANFLGVLDGGAA